MKNRILCFLISVLLVASTSHSELALASDRYPGVVEGQFLAYNGELMVTSNDTEFMDGMNFSNYYTRINITVLQISGENITYKQIGYTNLTDAIGLNATVKLNVETGTCNYSYPAYSMFFVSANLSVNDSIYVGTEMVINETIFASYLGLPLEVNHYYVETNATNVEYAGLLMNMTARNGCHWDKATGVLLEGGGEVHFTRSDGVGGLFVTHLRSQIIILLAIPVIPEFPSFLILPLFMLATLLAVIVYKRIEYNKKLAR